jgi:hypothetical protein
MRFSGPVGSLKSARRMCVCLPVEWAAGGHGCAGRRQWTNAPELGAVAVYNVPAVQLVFKLQTESNTKVHGKILKTNRRARRVVYPGRPCPAD